MKRILLFFALLGTIALGTQAFACPNLYGNYFCEVAGDGAERQAVNISQRITNGVHVLTFQAGNMAPYSLPMDNEVREYNVSGRKVHARGYCSAGKVFINAALQSPAAIFNITVSTIIGREFMADIKSNVGWFPDTQYVCYPR